jgi:acyl-CoA thioesterase-2
LPPSDIEPITARRLLDLERIAPTRFRSRHSQRNHGGTLFGGQAIAQALIAASTTVVGWPAHSLHAYFLRGAADDVPVEYEVARLRDGRRFATRRVSAIQNGRLIFEMLCSFHDAEPGFEHRFEPPSNIPGPDGLARLSDFVRAQADRLPESVVGTYGAAFPLELGLVDPEACFFSLLGEPRRSYWVRMPSAAEIDDAAAHRSLLAFLSDYWLVGVAIAQHALPTNRATLSISSIDHAVWFHRPARADDWLLYVTDSPSAGAGLGYARGLLFDRAGTLVASTAQEAVFRPL